MIKTLSRSLRARGLKQSPAYLRLDVAPVALFTGAWIETHSVLFAIVNNFVALFTGAWIETTN